MKPKNEIKQFKPEKWWKNVHSMCSGTMISEKELSASIGKPENWLSQAMEDCIILNIDDALAIAQAFDTTVERLAFGAITFEDRITQFKEELIQLTEEFANARTILAKITEEITNAEKSISAEENESDE